MRPSAQTQPQAWAALQQAVVMCERCPRLTAYRQAVAEKPKKGFTSESYWAKPVPGLGGQAAKLLIVGLAPAAHGANRTGRMFTGDGQDGMGAADFLARALHRAGLANQATSRHRDDGFQLIDAYLTAIVRCAPPHNKPTPEEIKTCGSFLLQEWQLLPEARVIVALGKLAFDQLCDLLKSAGAPVSRPRPKFGHGVEVDLPSPWPTLIGSYHPSRQNTQTRLLTPEMFDDIFVRAKQLSGIHRQD